MAFEPVVHSLWLVLLDITYLCFRPNAGLERKSKVYFIAGVDTEEGVGKEVLDGQERVPRAECYTFCMQEFQVPSLAPPGPQALSRAIPKHRTWE